MNWHQTMERAFSELKSKGAAAAEPYLRQALDLAGDHTEYRAMSMFNLALVCYDQKRPKETEALFAQSIELIQELLPKQNELYGMFLKTMIEFYEKENRYADSKKYYLLEIEHTRNMFGSRHPYVANMICEYADVLIKTNDYAEAEKNLTMALDIMSGAKGQDHLQNGPIHAKLALCYEALGRQHDAEFHGARASALQARKPKGKEADDQTTVEQQMD